MLISIADTLSQLDRHQAYDETEQGFVDQTKDFLSNTPNPFSRSTKLGHVTASAWIVDSNVEFALLIHHRKLDRWFQPGGHLEEVDPTVKAGSRREAMEETGLGDLLLMSDKIFDIDVHEIPENSNEIAHLHYDIRYIFQVEKGEIDINYKEVKNIKWIAIRDCLCGNSDFGSISRMAQKSIQFAKVNR